MPRVTYKFHRNVSRHCILCKAWYIGKAKDIWKNRRNTHKSSNFWKTIVGGSYYTPGLNGDWFLGPWAFIIPKSSVFLKIPWTELLKLGHFWNNFRFWLVWVELRKTKALSSLNFLWRYEKYKIGSCPQLLYA